MEVICNLQRGLEQIKIARQKHQEKRPTQAAETDVYIIIMDFSLMAQQGGSLHV